MEKNIFQLPFKVLSNYLFYRKNQFRDREIISKYQDRMLINLVQHASMHVPYYKELFRKINLNPMKFRGRIDLPKIPLLDKEIVRTRAKDLIADNAQKFGINWDSTSGSTGTPLHFITDDNTQANKISALLRSFNWAGYRLGDRVFSLQSYYFPDRDFKYNPFFNVLRFDSNKLKYDSAVRVVKKINQIKPKIFIGFPLDILMLSNFALAAGLEINSPRAIITYGETLSNIKRGLLEEAYKCKIFNYYSLHECAAMISECSEGSLHLIEDFAIHEIINEAGDPINDNRSGALAGTSLYNYAMPFIRYNIKDLVRRADKDQTCKCGRSFPIIEEILGKQCDFIATPDGRVLGAVMSHSIDNARGVICSQCVQRSINEIDINIVKDESFTADSQNALEKGLRKRLGTDISIKFHDVKQLRKTASGKTPFIISEIGNKYI